MKSRRFILFTCTFTLMSLFFCGVLMLIFNKATKNERKPNTESNYFVQNQVEKKQVEYIDDSPINILVLGLDEEEVRSDVIVLLNFSPKYNKLNILSIARDTKVNIKGKTAKINALVGMGGEKLAIQKNEEITGLKIDYYLTVNFQGFRKTIDALEGVEMNIPFDMDYDDPEQGLHIHLKKGRQVLNGEKAEEFVRYRKGNRNGEGYKDGDIGRIKMQQEFLKALVVQKVKLKYISKADDIYFILRKYVKTNIELRDVNNGLKNLKNIRYDEINAFTLPGEPAYINSLWFFINDKKATKEIVDNNFFK